MSTERRNWTKLNWHSLVFDELANRQSVMYYSMDGVVDLRDYALVRVNKWPIGSPCLPIGQFVRNLTVSVIPRLHDEAGSSS